MLSKFCLLCSAPGNGNWLGGLFARWSQKDISDEFKGITKGENTAKAARLPNMFKSPEKEAAFSLFEGGRR